MSSYIITFFDMKEAFYYLKKYYLLPVFMLFFCISTVSAQLIPRSALDKQTRIQVVPTQTNPGVMYSMYEPLMHTYVQKNNTLGAKETFLTWEQWGGELGTPLTGADRLTIYHLLAQEKNSENVTAPVSFIYNECPVAVADTKPSGTQVVYLHIDPNGNPDYTRYAIHVLEKDQYVQLDGSLGDTVAWVTLDRWETKDGIVIRTSDANNLTYRVKARGLSGAETPYSEPLKPSVCDYYTDVKVGLTAYAEPLGTQSNPVIQKALSRFSFLISLLDMLAWLLFLWGLFFFSYYLATEGKSKKKSKKIFGTMVWVFIVLSLVLVAKYYFFFTEIVYSKKIDFLALPGNTPSLQRTTLPLPLSVAKGTLVRYALTLQNSDQARSYVTLYQPVDANYIPESLSLNGNIQTDARDEDALWYDAATKRIGIKLQSFEANQKVTIEFVTQE